LATPHQDGSNSNIALGRSVSLFFSNVDIPPLWLLAVLDKLLNDPIV